MLGTHPVGSSLALEDPPSTCYTPQPMNEFRYFPVSMQAKPFWSPTSDFLCGTSFQLAASHLFYKLF